MKLPRKIYAIQHNVTKRIYIGSSNNVNSRYSNHLTNLRAGKHPIEDMQADFDLYGENYSFFILDEITEFENRKKEYEYMRKYNTTTRGVGYNYKDKAKKCIQNKPPYANSSPEICDCKVAMAGEYKKEITQLLLKCDDISILDLLYQLLKKQKRLACDSSD